MNNSINAARLLRLPESFANFDGAIHTKKTYRLVFETLRDYTKLVAGKPTVTTRWYSELAKTEAFGSYVLNQLASYVHWMNFVPNTASSCFKEHKVVTTPTGPFTGQTYWHGWQEAALSKNGNEVVLTLTSEPGSNNNTTTLTATTSPGFPEPTGGANPLVDILTRTVIKRSTGSTSGSTKSKMPRQDVVAKSGMGLNEIAFSTRVEWIAEAAADNTSKIYSHSCDVLTDENAVSKILFYVNGIEVGESFNASGLITAYGKQWPGVTVEWRLYDGDPTSVLGTSVHLTYSINDFNGVRLIESNQTKFIDAMVDGNPDVIEWNPEGGAFIDAWVEETGGGGKNDAVTCRINLLTGERKYN